MDNVTVTKYDAIIRNAFHATNQIIGRVAWKAADYDMRPFAEYLARHAPYLSSPYTRDDILSLSTMYKK